MSKCINWSKFKSMLANSQVQDWVRVVNSLPSIVKLRQNAPQVHGGIRELGNPKIPSPHKAYSSPITENKGFESPHYLLIINIVIHQVIQAKFPGRTRVHYSITWFSTKSIHLGAYEVKK